ncbi:Sphingosine N-acyltransferase lag1 [Coemansia biformis]|uniref:Sphingosine N-acyltransferase lag1 n=1 Tax=Coemansia biformis TaxID=1286918 RepID=A0A9W8D015_9FUNG|nr:Sphingosine N-acyltransferase lag1 [Coemansia biformis]
MSITKRPKGQSYFEAKAAKEAAARRTTPVARACRWAVDNQAAWSLALLALIHGHDLLLAGNASPLVHLQHKIPGDPQGRYYRGRRDMYFILHWVVVFTLVRVTMMHKVMEPFAKWWGVRSARKLTRFSEQGWLTIYYIVSNSVGLYVMYQEPHWMSMKHFWIDYPEGHRQMTTLMKSYYLVQMGFWFQQIFVLLIEEKRKDFVVMCVHHVVTCNLLGWSLYMNYMRIGNAILCCMDSSDIFLSGTKCLRYLRLEKLSVASFAVFVLSWVYTRHYLYMKMVLSLINHSQLYLDYDNWYPERGSFYNENIVVGFSALLLTLQALIIYWFALVLRIIYRVIFLSNLEDSRSDSEDGQGDDDEDDANKNTSADAPSTKKTD